MSSKSKIKRILRNHTLAFGIILSFQILSLFLFHLFLTKFLPQIDIDAELCKKIELIVLFAFGIIYIICDLIFIYNKIILVSKLKNKTPIKCSIEDFFLIGYTDDGRRRYNVYPIVRSINDSKLYLAYGDYSLANLNTKIFYMNNKIKEIEIYNEDRKPLSLGDTAYVFILKKINKPIKIRNNEVKLNGKFIKFLHFNEEFNIENFKNINIFKGITAV